MSQNNYTLINQKSKNLFEVSVRDADTDYPGKIHKAKTLEEAVTKANELERECWMGSSEYGIRIKLKTKEEEKVDWEEELGKLMSTWGKVLFVNKGRIGAGMQTAMYLKFYHFIKDLLSEREREGYEKGKDYQASLDRACYGTSFEKLEKGIIEDKSPLAPEKGIDWSSPMEFKNIQKELKDCEIVRVTDEEGAELDVLIINGRYFKSSDVEAYSSSIEEISDDEFKELVKSTKEYYEGT